jgi:endo-1,3-1,4-beta-glycanase ExoK
MHNSPASTEAEDAVAAPGPADGEPSAKRRLFMKLAIILALSPLVLAAPTPSTHDFADMSRSVMNRMAAPADVKEVGFERKDGSFFEPFNRLDTGKWYLSNGWTNGRHQACAWDSNLVQTKNGRLVLKLTDRPNRERDSSCAELRTTKTLGYGLYEARIRSASGPGLVTAMFTYTGPQRNNPHDEIDFEFVGRKPDTVQINYFTSGKSKDGYYADTPQNASEQFHDYAFEWSETGVRWYIDGKLVRTAAGNTPKHAGQLFFSLWNGTQMMDHWLGGFEYEGKPITAEIEWAAYTAPGERCLFPQSMSCSKFPAQRIASR